MTVLRFHHAGLIVEDLERALAFFELLGFETEEPSRVSGGWVDRVNGLDGTDLELAFVRAPDGSGAIEVTRFLAPADDARDPAAPANRPGLRHLAYLVDDIDQTVDRVRAAGYDTVRDVVDYENVYRMCYVRGPEGLIVELAEEIGG